MAGGVPAGRLSIEIVAEIARLQADLDKAKKAVKAASGDIAASAKAANDNLASMGSGMNKAGGGAKLASHHMANLSFQIQDVIVGLQGGQKPMTVFLQQGSQIAQIAAQAGVGLGGMASAVGAMAFNFAKAHPWLVAAAAAAGLVSAAMSLVTDEINKTSAVTVTWQDVMLGAFDVIRDGISSKVTAAFNAMGLDIGEVWDFVMKATKTAINFIISASLAVPRLIAATYDKIGPAFGDAFYSAANLAIEALNWLVKMSAAPLNLLIDAMNSAFGTKIPRVVMDGIGKLENPYTGGMAALGKAGAQSLIGSFTTDWVGEGAKMFSDAAQRRARMREAAEKAGEKAGSAGGKKMGRAMAEKAVKEVEDTFGLELSKAVDKLVKDFAKTLDGSLEEIMERISSDHEIELNLRIKNQQGIANAISNNLSGLAGMIGGNAGGMLSSILDMETVLSDGSTKRLSEQFGEELSRIFGADGEKFANVLSTALAGAGIGNMAGQTILGGSGSNVGSTIGGALGAAAAKEFLGKTLGAFAGPLGGIVGGVLGGLVGGMFKKTKKASATISGGGIDITGNSSSREAAAGQLAGSVTDAINEIAEALGADLDMALGKVSVGIRKKSLRIDPTGQGRTKGAGVLDFGQDQEAALKAAIADLISDGVLKGISAGMEKLLKGGDLEKQLDKALKFKGVFDELEQRTDPLAYDMKQLGKEFDELSAIFAEAGATTEEYAQLEQLRQLRIKEIQDQYAQEADALELLTQKRELEAEIMRLQGNATGALTLLRQLELEAMDATLRPLQEQIYALQDAAAKRELEIQLMEALGLAQDAENARRAEYLKTIPDSLHALQQQIWAAQDATKATEAYSTALSDARSQLTAAYNRETSALQQTADKFRGFADSLREFRNSLYGADSGMATLQSMTVALMKTGGLAAAGNADAMAALPGVGRDYLSVAKGSAATAQDYARSVALVAGYTDKAIASAAGKASSAEAQIAIMTKQYEKLAESVEEQVTFSEAMQRVKELLENPVVPLEPTPVALPEDYIAASNEQQQAQIDALNGINRDQNRRLDDLNSAMIEQNAAIRTMATNIASMAGVIKRVERQGRFATVEEA